MNTSRWFTVRPRDTLLIRDGRSFEAAGGRSSASEARGLGPWPSTVAGALGTAFTRATGTPTEPAAIRGPLLGHRDKLRRWVPHFATPADLVLTSTEQPRPVPRATRLTPLSSVPGEPAARTDLAGTPSSLLTSSTTEQVEPAGGWLPAAAMTDYLAGHLNLRQPLSRHGWIAPDDNPLAAEPRVGLARDGAVARDGYLYAATHQRPRPDWALLVHCTDSPSTDTVTPQGPVPFGGKARLADIAAVDQVSWPSAPASFPDGRVLLYVATPALWPDGWRPPLPPHAELVAASTGEPIPVPTASPRTARQTDQPITHTALLRWAVPPGSVYWLQFHPGRRAPGNPDPDMAAAQWAATIHATALGPALDPAGSRDEPGSAGTDRTATAGFGVVLVGRWAPPTTTPGPPANADLPASAEPSRGHP